MEKKKRTAWNIIRVIVCGAVLMFCVYSLFVKVAMENRHITKYAMDSGWKVTINGTSYANVSLSHFDKPQRYERGDIVSMERRLPYPFPYHAGLRIRVYQAEVRVYVDGIDANLTLNEFRILAFLGKYAGRVITYDAIIREIWGPNMKNDNRILRVNMANIRRKIEADPTQPRYIFTEIGVGYRLADGDTVS